MGNFYPPQSPVIEKYLGYYFAYIVSPFYPRYINTSLYPTYRDKVQYLNGLVLGVSGGSIRCPFSSQIVYGDHLQI